MASVEVQRPNILWLVSEDNSPEYLGPYGDVLGGSTYIDEAIDVLASGRVRVDLLVAARICLEDVADALAAGARENDTAAPKIQVWMHRGANE